MHTDDLNNTHASLSDDNTFGNSYHWGLKLLAGIIARNYRKREMDTQYRQATPTNLMKKVGRPRAIPDEWIPQIISSYESGSGYRAIARELEKQGLIVDWTTVRRMIRRCLGQASDSQYS